MEIRNTENTPENIKKSKRGKNKTPKPRKVKVKKSKPNFVSTADLENLENIENIGNFTEAAITAEYVKKTLKFKESNVLQINAKYPNFSLKSNSSKSNKKVEKNINAFYNSAVNKFIIYCEKSLYKSAAEEFLLCQNTQENQEYKEFKSFGAVITFECVYNKQGFSCVYLDINIYSGKGRGNIIRKAHIWNLSNGELYSPGKFINFTPAVKKKICEYICKTMESQIERNEERYIHTDIQTVYKYLSIDNLYLTDKEKGCVFFFPQGTVASSDSGIISFVMPEKIINEL